MYFLGCLTSLKSPALTPQGSLHAAHGLGPHVSPQGSSHPAPEVPQEGWSPAFPQPCPAWPRAPQSQAQPWTDGPAWKLHMALTSHVWPLFSSPALTPSCRPLTWPGPFTTSLPVGHWTQLQTPPPPSSIFLFIHYQSIRDVATARRFPCVGSHFLEKQSPAFLGCPK